MSSTESTFLCNVEKLNQSLALIAIRLKPVETHEQDLSQLTYNYHVHHLSWSRRLVQEKSQPPEIGRVTVDLDYFEAAEISEIATISLSVLSEIFQSGSYSRVSSRKGEKRLLNDQLFQDLSDIVSELFVAGWEALEPSLSKGLATKIVDPPTLEELDVEKLLLDWKVEQ